LKWWGGTAGLVDLSLPAAARWYRDRLRFLKDEIGVDGFKIDGGDAKYQPPPLESSWHAYPEASGYADLLLALFEDIAPALCETRTAWLSQHRKILWRLGGKDSHWGSDNGLKAMVRLALHSSLLGYDMLIPDMIPGRVQTLQSDMALPTDELFVRWTEVSTWMPIMQFSYFPWNYAPAVDDAARKYAAVHKALENYLVGASRGRRAPLLRPIWYDSPAESDLYDVDDEFLLGGDILVAPVLDPGRTEREIVLPRGTWRDAWTGARVETGRLAGYPAPCPGIPVFVREESPALLDTLCPLLQVIRRGSIASGETSATYSAGLDRDLGVTG
jgi:alpha-glucosidase (family GH31 glycosyl hydrolase)